MMWRRPAMRTALAARDIAAVFRLLQRVGVSQRRIAALTGQSQSEISEILGGRHVVSYDVLARIADGLGVPRGQLGLAYDESTAAMLAAEGGGGEDEDEQRRMVARVAELTVGTAGVDPQTWEQPFAVAWGPTPSHVGLTDVARLEAVTEQLRAMDHEFGGGACRDAVLAQVGWAQQLLRAEVSEEAARALHIAVANLHLLAGWTSFDIGLADPARQHFGRALEHARFVDEQSLVAKVLYCMGRVHVHHGLGTQALKMFQLGQVAAQQSGFGRAVAMLHANLAWAHALVGETKQTLASIGRARDEFARSEQEDSPGWLRFFDSAELQALRATALIFLPEPTPQQRAEAIERLLVSTALRELPLARSRAFELATLSWQLLDNGDIAQGVHVGHEAIDVAAQLRSKRVIDRFGLLQTAAQRHLGDPGVRDLSEKIKTLRSP